MLLEQIIDKSEDIKKSSLVQFLSTVLLSVIVSNAPSPPSESSLILIETFNWMKTAATIAPCITVGIKYIVLKCTKFPFGLLAIVSKKITNLCY